MGFEFLILMSFPVPIEQLIREFKKLPSVGERTAERYVFHLLRGSKKNVAELAKSLENLVKHIQSCAECFDFSDTSPCKRCADTKRNKAIICVVHQPQDLEQLDKTGAFAGKYHVLRGLLKPDDPESIQWTKAKELLVRVANSKDITEVILALNPDLPGETTMMLLEKKLKELRPDITVSRLARGLPMGADLQYADDVTLGSAITHRTKS